MSLPRPSWMIVLAAIALLLAGLACNAIGGASSEPTATRAVRPAEEEEPTEEIEEEPTEEVEEEPTEEVEEEPTEEIEEEPTEEPTEEVEELPTLSFEETGGALLEDTFDENVNGWDEDADDSAAREFRDGAYSLQVFNTVWFAWANPVTENFEDIHIQVTVSNVGGNDPAFGVLCSYQNSDAFYFLGFGDDGYYGIGRIEGDDFVLLTGEENRWAQSDAIELFQEAYTLEADCQSDGTLRLIVDGVTIAEAQDPNYYGAGGVGLFVQSFDNVPVDVEFDDLVVTQIE